jgi:two-component system sensor histidine kinase CpxA
VHLPLAGRTAPDRVIWVIRANNLTGNGLFFDLKPLIIAVSVLLGLSILFWMPFAISITRYIGKLKSATDEIADGKFQVNLDTRRRDELGSLGSAIVSMSSRLDHLVSGQKRFLGDIAHELCSPLARMRTGLSILETKLPESEQARLAAIEEEATELAELIDEILAFSRSTAGISQIKGKPLCLHDLITDLLSRENHQLSVENNIAPELHVLADQKLLQRAIGNLIRNTIRYAGPNATLILRASLRDASIVLQIIDNGPGVPDAEIPHLFEPFYRPDIARTRETGGVGLGLTIVKSCIVACGGSIVASNAKPQGFAIEITLPLA